MLDIWKGWTVEKIGITKCYLLDQQRWYHLQSLAWKFTAILYLIHSSFIIVALSSSMNFCNKSNLLKIIHWWQSLQDLLLLHWFVSVAFWFKNRWVYKQEEPDRSSKGCIGHPALQDDTRWMYLSQTIGCYLFCTNERFLTSLTSFVTKRL